MSPEEMGPSASSRPPTTPPYELASPYEQVVSEPALLHRDAPAPNIGPTQPFRIAFVVDLMPNSDQPFAARPGYQRIEVVGDASGRQIDPPDHAPNEIRASSKLEKLACLA